MDKVYTDFVGSVFKESQHQRIIYSGQLLNDNLILKDVFREVSNWNLCAGMKRLCLSMHRKPYILSPSLILSFNCIQHQPAYMAKIDRFEWIIIV